MISDLKTLLGWFWLLLVCGLYFASPALAADYALVPSLRVEERYNDNIFFEKEDDDPQDDYITTLTPGLLLRRHAERLSTEVYGQGHFVYYRDEEDYNETEQLYRASLNHQATEHLSWGGSGSYTIDNQIDRDVEMTGLTLGTVERRQQSYRGFGNLIVAERTSVNLSGGYSREDFDDAEFWENWGADASLGVSHRPRSWPRTVLQAQANYRHYRFDRDQRFTADYFGGIRETRVAEASTTDNCALSLGLGHDLTERLNIGINGGARYTFRKSESEVRYRYIFGDEILDDEPVEDSSDDDVWGFVGSADLTHRGERSEVSVGLSHDLQPASGSGETVERTSLNGSWGYQVTTAWRLGASVSYYWNHSDDADSGDDTDTATLTVAPLVRYACNRDIYLQAVYRYTRVEDREDEESSQRHLAALTLYLKYDLLDQ
jgi:hypothetical protein